MINTKKENYKVDERFINEALDFCDSLDKNQDWFFTERLYDYDNYLPYIRNSECLCPVSDQLFKT